MERADAFLDLIGLCDWWVNDRAIEAPEGMQLEFSLNKAKVGEVPRVTLKHGSEDTRCRVVGRTLEIADLKKGEVVKTTYLRLEDVSRIVLRPLGKSDPAPPLPHVMSARTGKMR